VSNNVFILTVTVALGAADIAVLGKLVHGVQSVLFVISVLSERC